MASGSRRLHLRYSPPTLASCSSPIDDIIANKFTNHVLHHLAMLRYVKQESDALGCWSRRFPKTGGFRSKLGATDWEWLNPLLEGLQTGAVVDDGEGIDAAAEQKVDVDEHGFPTISRG